jgi:type I restriction enzyme S subunit
MSEKLPDGWKRVKLGEVADVTKLAGFEFTKYIKYVDEGEIIALRALNIRNGYLDLSNVKKIYKHVSDSLERSKLYKNDIIFTYVGANIGQFALVPENDKFHLAPNICRIRCTDKCEPYFLYSYFRTNFFQENLEGFIHGSTQPTIPMKTIRQIPILLPPFPEQKAISGILSSLDDKIDLLHRQNKTLEKMAQTLFRKWFIEDAQEDWEEVSLGDSELSTIISSGIKKFEREKIFLATGDIQDTDILGGELITYDDRPSRANMQPVIYSVWFAKKVGTKKLLMFDDYSDIDKYILSTGFAGLKTTELSHYYIWCFIMSKEFQEIKDSFVSGSVQPDITNEGIKQITILKPDNETFIKFNKIVKPWFAKIQANKKQIRTLEQLRDRLLPKLMSGEVRVRK